MEDKQEIKLGRINIDRIYHTQNNMPIRDMLLAVVKAQLQSDQQVVDKLQTELFRLEADIEAMQTNQCSMCTLWQRMKSQPKKEGE